MTCELTTEYEQHVYPEFGVLVAAGGNLVVCP